MWSGPRNISTALMRSFENRPDTFVTDEPFYSHFLSVTKDDHPGKDAIIKSQPVLCEDVVGNILGPVPEKKEIWYQKHMSQHITSKFEFDWVGKFLNCFLIRNPKEVIVSFAKRFNLVSSDQLGYSQQARLVRYIQKYTGKTPPVFDSKDILINPEKSLKILCKLLNISFMSEMLSWPSGKRETDGIWAPHWYSEVEKTTGFQPYLDTNLKLESRWLPIYKACKKDYEFLKSLKININ